MFGYVILGIGFKIIIVGNIKNPIEKSKPVGGTGCVNVYLFQAFVTGLIFNSGIEAAAFENEENEIMSETRSV